MKGATELNNFSKYKSDTDCYGDNIKYWELNIIVVWKLIQIMYDQHYSE